MMKETSKIESNGLQDHILENNTNSQNPEYKVENTPISIFKSKKTIDSTKKLKFNTTPSRVVYEKPKFEDNILSSDLIKEYTKYCEDLKVKPIDAIINQLQPYGTINGNIKSLNLNGLKLDSKIIDSLELIFRKIKIDSLNVENSLTDEDACVNLCEILEFYDSTYILSIGNNIRINIRGWRAISQFISRSEVLEEIYLNRMVFTEATINLLSRSLRKSSSLRVLNLSNCYINGSRIKILSEGFTVDCCIHELYLAENKISSGDCQFIGNILRNNRHLRVLNLENNAIHDLGIKFICDALMDDGMSRLERLQLWNTGLTSVGMQYIASYLYRSKLTSFPDTLISLNVGRNRIGDDGIMAIKSALMQNKCIERLGLVSTKLTCTGIIAMAEIIADNRSLIRLDLRDNYINEAGIIALSQALRHNSTMLKINFNADLKVDSSTEVELNQVLNDIRDICLQNRQRASLNGKIDDAASIYSSLSRDSPEPSSTQPSTQPSFSDYIINILSSPWRLTKSKFFNSYNKVDVEMMASDSPTEPEAFEAPNHSDSLPDLRVIPDSITEKSEESEKKSRFQVRKVSTNSIHRRCASDNIHRTAPSSSTQYKVNRVKDTVIKINLLNNTSYDLNSSPQNSSNVVNNKKRSDAFALRRRSRSLDTSYRRHHYIPLFKRFYKPNKTPDQKE